jgi:uncharacterized protein involved in exopolysaccharide biosynthesis
MVTHTKSLSGQVDPQSDPAARPTYVGRTVAEESLVDIGRYVRAVQRRLLPIVILATIAAVLAFISAGRQQLMYEGVTTLLVVPAAQPLAAQINPATFRAIVENASLAAEVIDELKLRERLPQAGGLTPHEFVDANLSVEEIRATNIVKVKVTMPDANLAAAASRRVAEKAIALTQQITQREGSSIQGQLKNHLDAAQDRLRSAEQELLAYKQRAQVDLIKGDADAQLRARADLLDLTVNIAAERARLAAAEAEITRQPKLLSTPRTPAAEDALRHVPGAPETGPDIDTRQLDLSNPYVNPVYQTLDFQIAMSRARVAALQKQRDELINVKKIGGKELAELSELYRRQIEQARLQGNYDLATRVYSDLSVRYEQSRTQALGNFAQLQIIDAAIPPDHPLSRHRVQEALFGASAGLFAGTLIVLVLATRRHT